MKHLFRLILIILAVSGQEIYSQRILTLNECYDLAMKKSLLTAEKETYESIRELRDRNLSSNWLPSLDAGANFIYNSDIVNLRNMFSNIPIPGLAESTPLMPHDQYKVTVDINQMIYDGGSVKKARNLEEAEMKVNKQQTETDLYKLRSQINSYYFAVLMMEKQMELMNSYLDIIKKRILTMQSALSNGMILKSDIDVMNSEKIRVEQNLTEIELKKLSFLAVLSDITGVDNELTLILPQLPDELSSEIVRPELGVFDLRKDQLEAGIGVLQTRRLPKAFGFATLGYGSPQGSDFLNDKFGTYYILGAGIKWNIFDWNNVNREKQQLTLQQGMLEGRKSDLTDNIKRSLELKTAEIKALKAAMSRDSELIAIRKRITASAESQYQNGTITATELLSEMNTEKQAEINFEIHRISLELSRVEYLNISGKEIQ